MKQFLQNVLVRALCVLTLGILFIVLADSISVWTVRICGLLFILPGCVALISYFRRDPARHLVMLYPIVASGSILFGGVLMIWPDLFVDILRYLLSGILMVAAMTEGYGLWNVWRGGQRFSGYYFLIPVVPMALALVVLLNDRAQTENNLANILLGSGFTFYALAELWTIYLLRRTPRLPKLPSSDEPE